MTEDQLEREALSWLQDVGYTHLYGPDIAHDGATPERASYLQVLLPFRLREAIRRLNPGVPSAAREDAFKQIPAYRRFTVTRGNLFNRLSFKAVDYQNALYPRHPGWQPAI
jgi:type I site-specific restriction-modification system R (restriction) subunit